MSSNHTNEIKKRVGDFQNDEQQDPNHKRIKIMNSSNPSSATLMKPDQVAALLEAKKREIAERLSKLNQSQTVSTNTNLRSNQSQESQRETGRNSMTANSNKNTKNLPSSFDIQKKLEEARLRAERIRSGLPISPSSIEPTQSSIALNTTTTLKPTATDTYNSSVAQNDIISKNLMQSVAPKRTSHTEIHPALIALQQDPSLPASSLPGLVPKFATVKANLKMVETKLKKQAKKEEELKKRQELEDLKNQELMLEDFKSNNPYFDNSLRTKASVAPKARKGRKFKFFEHGKFIEEANKLRAQEQLEKLKQKIAETAQKTGIETEMDLVSEVAIRVDPPPPVEWWDAQLLPNHDYEDLDRGNIILDDEHEMVTNLVHHPLPIQPPGEKEELQPLPLMLTKKERKKLRRHRRLEAQKERQDKIRMGLLPPEQPKLRISNLMRVLGTEAVQDPTQMEKVVRAQMAARQAAAKKHDDKTRLSEEQKKEKKREKLKEDTANGVHVAVFRVKDLSHPQNKYKVNINAQQYNLTGIAIIYQKFSLVVVEGGSKGIKAYKKLMLRRIDWAGKGKLDAHDVEDGDHSLTTDGNEITQPARGDLDLRNTSECALVWEGMVKTPAFKYFRFKPQPTDQSAREFLDHLGVAHYWDTAKNYQHE